MINTRRAWTCEFSIPLRYAIVRREEDGLCYNFVRRHWEPMDAARWSEFASSVEVAEPATETPAAPPADKPKPEQKESPEDIKKRARKPPAEGPCKGCGKNLPLNRLMLCYKCWVNKNLMDEAKSRGEDFIPGIDPHPKTCQCDLPEHGGARTENN